MPKKENKPKSFHETMQRLIRVKPEEVKAEEKKSEKKKKKDSNGNDKPLKK